MSHYVITLSCPDRTGIVARISTFLAKLGASITEAAYHADVEAGVFCTRQVVDAASVPFDVDELRARFAPVAAELGGEHRISDTGVRKRAVLLVTRDQHCLHDILGRVWADELPVEITQVIGNHTSLEPVVAAHGVPFHHVPFPAPGDPAREQGKVTAFEEIRKLVDADDPDAIVLARFMQVLPAHLCEAWAGRAINIHHSFLPSFAGARPLPPGAPARGEADRRDLSLRDRRPRRGPDHRAGRRPRRPRGHRGRHDAPGRDIERLVLARGLRWHLEDRVLIQGNRTVVFR